MNDENTHTIGLPTFGKGLVQRVTMDVKHLFLVNFEPKGLAIKKTAERYYFASDETPDLRGIRPDFETYRNPDPQNSEIPFVREIDYYPYPKMYESRTGAPLISGHDLTALKKCVFEEGDSPEKIYQSKLSAEEGPDLQVIYATKVLECKIKARTEANQALAKSK
jgi:hypothetical protein